ncbi:Dehydration-responsive element-binding protein 2D [Camellia lanceoleosa]|uniref:Dehydration-responsive element-binding protein 2D n=1 Tax=Camellia lanceoleosa TaxID=1840588 RepID=A0ACC0HFH1_9ERIC|nr:Dehydration-responsive element-binding protein 2D [Camellia lanceoleosa]
MLKSVVNLREKKQQQRKNLVVKKPDRATSRKGCMRGKGGPKNASFTYKGSAMTWGKWVAELSPTMIRVCSRNSTPPLKPPWLTTCGLRDSTVQR